MTPNSRIVAADRATLVAFTLPTAPRFGLLQPRLDDDGRPRRDGRGRRQALVLTGEGGIGKSVLLGQYLDHLEVIPAQAAVLVSCASIDHDAELGGLEAADKALGVATGHPRGREAGLLSLLNELKADSQNVALLIDTLDLRLNQRSVIALAALLSEALDIADVVVTCRTHEYVNFLESGAPRLSGRLNHFPLPVLTPDEIVDWANSYLAESLDVTAADRSAFLDDLRSGVIRSRSLLHVCSLPVRLALTCRTFGDSGRVPEELTVHGLYEKYWDTRVRQHAQQGCTEPAAEKERTALKLASHVVRPDGTVALHVSSGSLDEPDRLGVELLLSEGVVRDMGTAYEFFHQTFAEYGHARWLHTRGAAGPEVGRLAERLADGQTWLWDIACSLLLQVKHYSDYVRLTALFPAVQPPGARARTFAALRRAEPEALADFFSEVSGQIDLLPAVLGALADAPYDHLPAAFDVSIKALRSHPTKLAKAATLALAALLPRRKDLEIPSALGTALSALAEVRVQVEKALWLTLPEKLIKPLAEQRAVLPVLREHYGELGRHGQQAALRAHLAFRARFPGDAAVLAAVALNHQLPKLSDDEAVELIAWFWGDRTVREVRGWDSLLTMLTEQLPSGWQNGQVRFVRSLAEQDRRLRDHIFDALVAQDGLITENHVNVVKQLAVPYPRWLASRFLELGELTEPRHISAVTAGAEGLAGATTPQRRRLLMRLKKGRAINPRAIYPAQIILAGDDLTAHEEILSALERATASSDVLDSAIDAWLFRATHEARRGLRDRLRALVDATDSETRQRRARLEGRFAVEDPEARSWVTDHLLRQASPQVASTAVRTIAETAEHAGADLDTDTVDWLASLLASEHSNAVREVAAILVNKVLVRDEDAAMLVPAVLARLRHGVAAGENKDLLRALLDLLVRVEWSNGLPRPVVEELFELTCSRITPQDRRVQREELDGQMAAIRDLKVLVNQVMAREFPLDEVRTKVGTVLVTLADAQLLTQVLRVLSSLLIGLGHRDRPATCAWMEDLFGTQGISQGMQQAIADAMCELDGDHPGGRAARLKDRPDCGFLAGTFLSGRIRT